MAQQREARQRSNLPADRRFRPGRVYSRRTRADTSSRPTLTGGGLVVRIRPGCVYSRRRVRGSSVSGPCHGCATSRHQWPHPVHAVGESEVDAGGSTMNDESQPALQFISGISHPLPQPLLQVPQRRASPP
jgi:hypothetical protein